MTMSRLHKAGLEERTHSGGVSSSPVGYSNARCCSVVCENNSHTPLAGHGWGIGNNDKMRRTREG